MATGVKVFFELKDGRSLTCFYCVSTRRYFGAPDEEDVSEPDYELEGELVELCDLPKGLATVARNMYEGWGSFRTELESLQCPL